MLACLRLSNVNIHIRYVTCIEIYTLALTSRILLIDVGYISLDGEWKEELL